MESTKIKSDEENIKRIEELTSPEARHERHEKEEIERLEAIRKETNPWKIVEIAKIHEVTRGDRGYSIEVVGYREKIAAMWNPNTPTFFMLLLYHYPEPHPARVRNFNDMIGPSPTVYAPYVNDEVRYEAEKALIRRDWKLTKWDKANLSLEVVAFYEEQLRKDKEDLEKEKKHSDLLETAPQNTELGKMTRELIGFLKRK